MPTHLTHLKLSHFRSHKRVEMTTDARPVALYGANGAGKTNILEAVSLMSPGRGLRRASAEEMTRRPEALGWKITAMLEADTRAREIESLSEQGSARQVRIDGKPASQIALGKLARVLWLIPSMDRLWIDWRRAGANNECKHQPKHLSSVGNCVLSLRQRSHT